MSVHISLSVSALQRSRSLTLVGLLALRIKRHSPVPSVDPMLHPHQNTGNTVTLVDCPSPQQGPLSSNPEESSQPAG